LTVFLFYNLQAMKQIAAIILLVMIAVNVALLLPKHDIQKEPVKTKLSLLKAPKIDLTEVNPGILPNLMKS